MAVPILPTFVNGAPPALDADNLNDIVSAVEDAHARVDGISVAGYGIQARLEANHTTGTWPTRTVPTGYTGVVIWDAIDYERKTGNLSAEPAGRIDGDHWRRVRRG